MADTDYVCAVSGAAAPPAEDEDAAEEDLPIGWSRVIVTTRRDNPKHGDILAARAFLADQQLSMIPEGEEAEAQREAARPTAELIAEAAFAALTVATPRYLYDDHEVVVSEEQLPQLLALLGIEE